MHVDVLPPEVAGRIVMKSSIMRRSTAVAIMALMMISMTAAVFADSITSKEAVKIALKDAGLKKSQVKRLESEREGSKYEVEFKQKKGKKEFDYNIRRSDGKILKKSVDYNRKKSTSGDNIGKAAARKVAADHANVKVSVVESGKCRYDKSDREYEIKFKSAGNIYEYEIDSVKGKIKEYTVRYKK